MQSVVIEGHLWKRFVLSVTRGSVPELMDKEKWGGLPVKMMEL